MVKIATYDVIVYGHDRDARRPNPRDHGSPAIPRSLEEMAHPASTAAVALAQLHYQTQSFDVGSEAVDILVHATFEWSLIVYVAK